LFGLILLLDVWATVKIAQSGAPTAAKVLRIVLIMLLPAWPILRLIVGRRRSA
jgi:hypothetical protein